MTLDELDKRLAELRAEHPVTFRLLEEPDRDDELGARRRHPAGKRLGGTT